jgi:DNA-binding transcriptional LysR family regulator
MKNVSWEDLRVLLEVHRHRSFLSAGSALGMSTATVARRIQALERSLARRLVQRTSRGALLEKEALVFVKIAEDLERSLQAQWREGGGGSPFAGVVRVSMPEGFGPPAASALAPFLRQHPETHVELISELRYVDLASREADIGIRGARSSSPVLVERLLGEVSAGVYASEAYLSRALPKRALAASDYADQDFIVEDARQNIFSARGATGLERARIMRHA